MHIKFINSVSPGTLGIIHRKVMSPKIKELIEQNKVTTVGLCHGEFTDMMAASDIAEKASNVSIGEISGLCPQHNICIGIFGDTTSVKEAIKAIKNGFKNYEVDNL